MNGQDWTPIILKKKQIESNVSGNIKKTVQIHKADKELNKDEVEAPKTVDCNLKTRVLKLRMFLKMNQADFAKLCSVPLPEYKDLENGKLIQTKARSIANRIFQKYKKVMSENEI